VESAARCLDQSVDRAGGLQVLLVERPVVRRAVADELAAADRPDGQGSAVSVRAACNLAACRWVVRGLLERGLVASLAASDQQRGEPFAALAQALLFEEHSAKRRKERRRFVPVR